MEQEKFFGESLKEHGLEKAPHDLLANVMQEIEAKELKKSYSPLLPPWILKSLIFSISILLAVLLFLIKDSAGEAYIKLPEWSFHIPEISLDISPLILSAVFAVFLLVVVDGLRMKLKQL